MGDRWRADKVDAELSDRRRYVARCLLTKTTPRHNDRAPGTFRGRGLISDVVRESLSAEDRTSTRTWAPTPFCCGGVSLFIPATHSRRDNTTK